MDKSGKAASSSCIVSIVPPHECSANGKRKRIQLKNMQCVLHRVTTSECLCEGRLAQEKLGTRLKKDLSGCKLALSSHNFE